MDSIKIAIAEDNSVIRRLLLNNFDRQQEIQVVFAAENGKSLMDNLKKIDAEIVLLDINMPVMDGYVTMIELHKRFPKIKVIMYSSDLSEETADYFKNLGAFNCLPKESTIEKIVEAINEAHAISISVAS